MQGDDAVLHVCAHPHPLGAADQYRDATGAGGREEAGFLAVVLRLVDEPDALAGYAVSSERRTELVVCVPPAVTLRGAEVQEHQLERPSTGTAGVVQVDGAVVGGSDPIRSRAELPAGRVGIEADEAEVERGFTAIRGDLQHVVVVGVNPPAADLRGPLRELQAERLEGLGAGHDHGFGCAPGYLGYHESEFVEATNVGDSAEHPQEVGDVREPGETGLHPVASRVRCHLKRGDRPGERGGPSVEVLDPGRFQCFGLQVVLHDPHLRDGVRDRCRGRERRDPGPVGLS